VALESQIDVFRPGTLLILDGTGGDETASLDVQRSWP
jgi:hypothetical protein